MNIHNIVNIMENDTEIFNILKNCPYEILKQWEIEDYPEETVV